MYRDAMIPGINPVITATLMHEYPFFSSLLMMKDMIVGGISDEEFLSSSARAYTNCVDEVHFHNGWLNGIESPEGGAFVVAHELMHVVHRHNVTRGSRNPTLWNIAADFYINLVLSDMGFPVQKDFTVASFQTTVDHLNNPMKKAERQAKQKKAKKAWAKAVDTGNFAECEGVYEVLFDNDDVNVDMSVVEIYNKLFDKMSDDNKQKIKDGEQIEDILSGKGDIKDYNGPLSEQEVSVNVAKQVAKAIQRAKSYGKEKGDLDRVLGACEKIKPDFTEALKRILLNKLPSSGRSMKHTYSRINPVSSSISALIGQQVVYPSRRRKRKGECVVAIDTSGSMTDDDLAKAAATIEEVRATGKFATIRVLYADTQVAKEEVFKQHDKLVLRPRGGGGTDFRPVFKHVWDNKIPCNVLIYITDGFGPFPSRATKGLPPTIWCILADPNNSITPPFGARVDV